MPGNRLFLTGLEIDIDIVPCTGTEQSAAFLFKLPYKLSAS